MTRSSSAVKILPHKMPHENNVHVSKVKATVGKPANALKYLGYNSETDKYQGQKVTSLGHNIEIARTVASFRSLDHIASRVSYGLTAT